MCLPCGDQSKPDEHDMGITVRTKVEMKDMTPKPNQQGNYTIANEKKNPRIFYVLEYDL